MNNPTAASQVRLPANRAFVLQFEVGSPDQDLFRGRVEHLSSGQVVHFASMNQLAEFVSHVIGAPEPKE